jgi:hypothetical protein
MLDADQRPSINVYDVEVSLSAFFVFLMFLLNIIDFRHGSEKEIVQFSWPEDRVLRSNFRKTVKVIKTSPLAGSILQFPAQPPGTPHH